MISLRASEWVLVAYFSYTSVLALVLPLRAPIPAVTVTLNLTILAAYALLAWAHSLRGAAFLGMIRDWFPFTLMLLAYREMGWFAQPERRHDLERLWVGWDRAVLDGGLRAVIESLGPLLPAVIEFSYILVYVLGPFALAMLYVYDRRERADSFLFTFILAVLLCYAQFPLWPSEPPRAVFPGTDLPSYNTVFRRINLWMLGGQGIHTSVFPSAHVAGAFACAFAMIRDLPERPLGGPLPAGYGRAHRHGDRLWAVPLFSRRGGGLRHGDAGAGH